MPYPEGHHREVKKKIIESARRLFNRKGFERTSIAEIMRGAGLTRGGFYFYFEKKSDLYREVMNCFFTDPEWKNRWDGVDVNLAAADAGAQVVRAYLSEQHLDEVENACPMVALPSDVARSDEAARHAFETAFCAMVQLLEGSRVGKTDRSRAQATAALCIGGMVVARALVDKRRADELRRSCLAVALELGEWAEQKNGRPARA